MSIRQKREKKINPAPNNSFSWNEAIQALYGSENEKQPEVHIVGDGGEGFETLFDKKLSESGFNKKQIGDIKEVLDGICLHCFDGDSRCQCWNDE